MRARIPLFAPNSPLRKAVVPGASRDVPRGRKAAVESESADIGADQEASTVPGSIPDINAVIDHFSEQQAFFVGQDSGGCGKSQAKADSSLRIRRSSDISLGGDSTHQKPGDLIDVPPLNRFSFDR